MADQQERERTQQTTQEPTVKWEEHTRAAGNREGIPQDEAEQTPPGGDVRTIYSNDRDPGDAEPDQRQP
jgi:hypothetical protein